MRVRVRVWVWMGMGMGMRAWMRYQMHDGPRVCLKKCTSELVLVMRQTCGICIQSVGTGLGYKVEEILHVAGRAGVQATNARYVTQRT